MTDSAAIAVEDEDGFTELRDPSVPRLDGVGAAANGTPFFFSKEAEGQPGLFGPDYVRELIAKADAERAPATDPRETVTMSGSPAAIAAMIHGAAVRKAAPDAVSFSVSGSAGMSDADIDGLTQRIGKRIAQQRAPGGGEVEKAEESAATQNDLPDSAFAFIEPGGTKDESGRTVPRSKRHFNIHDAAHVRNALARAPQSPFGDKALPKIRAAAKKFGIDVSKETAGAPDTSEVAKDMGMDDDTGDGMDMTMDPTVVLATPDGEAPGDPNDPGSPAWEATDAATATKWTALAARLRSALGIMSDRESLEAATADPDDAEAAMDLSDAACAVDYVISVLAPFAIDEQAESDEGAMAMQMVGKAMNALDPAHLDTVESLGTIRKAGRALSSANETALRNALKALQMILASLPKAPDAPEAAPAAMTKETAVDESAPAVVKETTVDDALAAQVPTLGTPKEPASAETPAAMGMPGEVAKAHEPVVDPMAEFVKQLAALLPQYAAPTLLEPVAKEQDAAAETPAPAEQTAQTVVKAEKAPQMPVYDAKGNLMGVVDPAELTRLAEPAMPAAPAAKAEDAHDPAPAEPAPAAEPAMMPVAPAAPPTDLTPAPAASVGTPADAVPADDAAVAKATETSTIETPQDMLKGIAQEVLKAAIDDYSAGQADVVKGLEERNQALEERNEALKKQLADVDQRLANVEKQDATPRTFRNGMLPSPQNLRGQDAGGPTGLTNAHQLRKALAEATDIGTQEQISKQMEALALAEYTAMRERGAAI